MKIVHIAKHCRDSNGNVNVAVDLACAQAEAGHDVIFASEGGVLEPLLSGRGVVTERIVQSGTARDLARNLAAFVAFCRRARPDVIHAHMVTSALFGFFAARACGAKLVTTVHNSFDRQSLLMRLGDAVVAVSEAERAMLIGRGFDARKLTTILNGPNGSARESLAVAEKPFQTPCVTMVCGLHHRKGVADMVEAFAALTDRFPRWHLNIIGTGPDRDKLAALIAERGLARAHLVGVVPHPKPYLEQSAIFATCSYAEPLGLSTVEARAAGCAVIGSNVGGTPEAMDRGRAGQLFEPGNVERLRDILGRLMGDEAELAAWRRRAVDGVEAFEVSRMMRNHEALYESLLVRKRARRPAALARPEWRTR